MTGHALKLNSDLGEGDKRIDARIMPFVDQANIACGGHAGDEHSMASTVCLAKRYAVAVGAHPSYPDRENFGRVSLDIARDVLLSSLRAQVQSLQNVCKHYTYKLSHIKAHGALYTDCFARENLVTLLLQLAQEFECDLMLQARMDNERHRGLAQTYGVNLLFEGFVDRAYLDSGALVPRQQPHAVHTDFDQIVEQALGFRDCGGVFSCSGTWLALSVDSLCVHGDTDLALDAAQAIHEVFHRHR